MIPLSAEEAGKALGVDPLQRAVTGVSADTRTLRTGDLFVALRGDRFDGNRFVKAAFAAGASGAVVAAQADWAEDCAALTSDEQDRVYAVPDTLRALGGLAQAVRRKSGAKVVAVTGSMGKTGTKDLLRAMAGVERVVLATESNLNNEVGVPFTLLQIEPATELVVVEMGMRGLGQIRYLSLVAEPDVGLITNVAPVHLELLGSMECIAQAKAELVTDLPHTAVAVLPAGAEHLEPWRQRCRARVVTFGLEPIPGGAHADVVGRSQGVEGSRCLLQVRWPGGEGEVITPFSARYKLQNTLAAAAGCYAAGLRLEECLQGAAAVGFTPGRGDEYQVGDLIVLDDSYNANPQATAAALQHLVARAREVGGRPVAVLGDMLELGPDAAAYHAQVGGEAARLGITTLFAVGGYAEETARAFLAQAREGAVADWCGTDAADGAAALVEELLQPGDVVLVKASRRVRLDLVVQHLLSRTPGV